MVHKFDVKSLMIWLHFLRLIGILLNLSVFADGFRLKVLEFSLGFQFLVLFELIDDELNGVEHILA